MQRKQFNLFSDFQAKYLEETDELIIEGLANSTTKDRVGDIIKAEAWSDGGLTNYLKNPIVLAFHDHSRPIGKVTSYSISDSGLHITAKISKAAGDVATLIKDGILSAFSVGFMVKDAEYDKKSETFFVKKLELLEVSVVSVPANADSIFSIRKSFDNDDEYNSFKEEFIVAEKEAVEKTTPVEETKVTEPVVVEKTTLSKDDVAEIIKEHTASVVAETIATLEKNNKVEEKATDSEKTEMTVEVKESGVEKLIADLEKKFEDSQKSLTEQLEAHRAEIKEKSDEIAALQKARMTFEDRASLDKISEQEKNHAVLLSKILDRPLFDTKFAQSVITKSGGQHVPTTTDGTNLLWETGFNTSLLSEMRQRLVVGELFSSRTIQMPTPTYRIPTNPEAGLGEWINPTAYRSSDGSSTGTAADHQPNDIVLFAHKLAAKEFVGYEEEEDAIIPILPMINEAIVRRMARTWDRTLIHGANGGVTATDPISGLGTRAQTAGGAKNTTLSIGGAAKVTVAAMQTCRKGLGVWGLNPSDVIYVVSVDAYYDLLDDPDFRTMDLVGDRATIIRGQIGSVNGSPVIVSGEFLAKASGAECVLAVNTANFLVGELRGLMVERDRDVINQKSVIVATRRLAFDVIEASEGVSAISWAA